MTQEPDENLRAQLQDAIAKVRHQIDLELISNRYVGGAPIQAEDIKGLKAELAELESALANLHSS